MKGDSPEFLERVKQAALQVERKTRKALTRHGHGNPDRPLLVCEEGDPAERRLDELIAQLQGEYLREIADLKVRFRVANILSIQFGSEDDEG
jgi:hypothetical protein